MKSKILQNVLVAATLSATMFFSGCKPPQAAKKAEAEKKQGTEIKADKAFLTPVLAERLERRDIAATIATTGTIIPYRSRLLRTEEAGRLVFEKEWREGDIVSKGTLIARIDSETLEGDIYRAKADVALQMEGLEISKRSMDSAVREYRTIQDLYSRGISARKDVDSAELSMQRAINTVKQNEINLAKSEASLKTLVDREERLNVVAPFDGMLVARTTLDGTKPFIATFGSESITDFDRRLVGNEFAVCGLLELTQVVIRCDVTSRDIESLNLGQEAIATIYGSTEEKITGKVVEISRSVNQDTRAFQVDILVDNPEKRLRPGMFSRVEVVTERKRDTIVIDKSLIARRNNRDVVFIVEKAEDAEYQVAREIPIEIGLEARDTLEVTWGLQEGSAIVVRGFEVLQDKTPVTVLFTDEPVKNMEKDEAEKLSVEKSDAVTTGGAAQKNQS